MQLKDMDDFTLLRWKALLEGVNLIYDKTEECGIPLDKVSLRQTHLVRFIDEHTEKVKISKY